MTDKKMSFDMMSVLIPVFNNQEILEELGRRLVQVLPHGQE
jgi:hypothetical protein